jgi:hypothetical protein
VMSEEPIPQGKEKTDKKHGPTMRLPHSRALVTDYSSSDRRDVQGSGGRSTVFSSIVESQYFTPLCRSRSKRLAES